MKNKIPMIILVSIMLSSLGIFINPSIGQSGTTVKVNPPLTEYYTKATGQELTVDVKIMNVTRLYGLDIKFSWNTTFLDYVTRSVRVPRNTYLDGVLWSPTLQLADEINATAGTYWIAFSSISPAPSFNGTGTVFTMTFRIKYHPVQPEPDASITLKLESSDLAAEGGGAITHTDEDGTIILHALPPISTVLYVQPTVFRKSQGISFPLDVAVEDVIDLYAFDISVSYNTTVLDALSITEGPFLKSIGSTIAIVNEVNDTAGQVRLSLSLLGAPHGVNGTGKLFTIQFKSSTTATGPSHLNLTNTDLSNYDAESIEHAKINGQVTVLLVERLTHTVIVGGSSYNFTTSSSSSVTNFAYNDTEKLVSFDAIGPIDIPGFTNITMPKALLGLPASDTFVVLIDGNAIYYTRASNATHYILHFTYSHSSHRIVIKRTLIGDLNGDRKVDIYDIVVVAVAYDATPADPRWNSLADLASPWNKINIFDIVVVTRVYGRTWTA